MRKFRNTNTLDAPPSATGIALDSSTGWFAIVDHQGICATDRRFASGHRAAKWAVQRFDKSWQELQRLGWTVRGGYHDTGNHDSVIE